MENPYDEKTEAAEHEIFENVTDALQNCEEVYGLGGAETSVYVIFMSNVIEMCTERIKTCVEGSLTGPDAH